MTTMTESMERQTAESYGETLTEIWAAIDSEGEYEGVDAREYLDEMPLEIVWELGEPFAVVLGVGGPHVEITGGGRASGSGCYELSVYWGGRTATIRNEAIARTGDYFREYVDQS